MVVLKYLRRYNSAHNLFKLGYSGKYVILFGINYNHGERDVRSWDKYGKKLLAKMENGLTSLFRWFETVLDDENVTLKGIVKADSAKEACQKWRIYLVNIGNITSDCKRDVFARDITNGSIVVLD